MKLLTASALLCAMMALTTAQDCYVLKKTTPCPNGWTEYNNQCYVYVPVQLTWGDAQRKCQSMGANLASVHSLGEYQLIQKVISNGGGGSGRTWLGATDGPQEGYWFWIDGTPFTYSNWCNGEPNNSGGIENCAEMNFSGALCMNDEPCKDQNPSVCIKSK